MWLPRPRLPARCFASIVSFTWRKTTNPTRYLLSSLLSACQPGNGGSEEKVRLSGQYYTDYVEVDGDGCLSAQPWHSPLGLWNSSVLCWSQAWMLPARWRWKTSRTPRHWSPGSSPWPRSTASSCPMGSKMCQATAPPSISQPMRTSTPSGTWSPTPSTRCPSSPAGWTWPATLPKRPSQPVRRFPSPSALGCLPGSFYSRKVEREFSFL